ncbi:hypothetical protein E4633_08675 [Geomonas terrae]|uniref:Uncharacterized protein n=1 Tax=Geomonas terrae TaxID=2562681 RepID=A0A4S1CH26_9BACT|nr:hypothetical protein [Geomonas terrae]TGU72376.1 hypothetical protein E4633_08675 [Geomonas terrae]
MKPFQQIFPGAQAPAMTLEVAHQSGRIPQGKYTFLECFCTRPACDCRRVVLLVIDGKMRHRAQMHLSLDDEGPFSGPHLDPVSYQAPYADELLDFCVHSLNSCPDWFERLQRHYGEVRGLVDGRPYCGKPFPPPGQLFFRAMPSPDLESSLRESLRHDGRLCGSRVRPDAGKALNGIERLVELSLQAGGDASVAVTLALREELHRHLLANPPACEELAALLAGLSGDPDEARERAAAFRLLRHTLDFYTVEAQGGLPGARQQMQRLQRALLSRVFHDDAPALLQRDVIAVLAEARVPLMPELERMISGDAFPQEVSEPFLPGVMKRLAASGLVSPFDGADEMLGLFALSDAEMLPGLVWEMLSADTPLLRDIAALFLFNGDTELSRGVARMLAAVEGGGITPETLSRLIVTRNWFDDPVRGCIDEAIGNARKARVACAHMPTPSEVDVLAGPLDGAGNQLFYAVAPDSGGHAGCTVSLQEGGGVAECTVTRLSSLTEVDAFLAAARNRGCCIDSSLDYLGLRIAQALAQGNEQGRAPGHWLVRLAEILGCSRWKAAPLDARRELEAMLEEMAENTPLLLEPAEQIASLEESGEWCRYRALFGGWKEEGSAVTRLVVGAGPGSIKNVTAVIERLCDQLLEQKRQTLMDRLVLQALWLKSSPQAPIAWQRMYHVAQAMADPSIALKEIPLAVSVAKQTLKAYQARTASRDGAEGDPA